MREAATVLRDKIESLINSMGYEFVGCEWQQQGRRRIYIDSPTGVTVDDCARVSRQVGAMLEVDEPAQGSSYILEVSSPGIDRPLFGIAHYQKQVGQRIKLNLRVALHNRRRWTGTLLRVEGEQIHLLSDEVEVVIPFSNIEKANVIANIHL